MSNTCSLCNRTYVWPADLKCHLKSKHGHQKSTLKQQQPYTLTPGQQQQQQRYTLTAEQQQQQPYMCIPEQQPYTLSPEQQQQQQPYTFTPEQQQQQPYSQSNEEEPYYILKTYFTFPINTIPIISCHGSIHLPV